MKSLIAALGFTLLASPVFARTTVSTPPIAPVGPADVYNCTSLSTATKPLTVLVSITTVTGNVLASQTFTAVLPGEGGQLGTIDTTFDTVYCSFEFSGGSSKSLRGAIEMFGPGHTFTLPGS